MTERTIEQRWKAVWVDREEVAKLIWDGGTNWDNLHNDTRWPYLRRADALLPLIEKAVREARKAEARLWLGMTCNEEADARIAKLEAGE